MLGHQLSGCLTARPRLITGTIFFVYKYNINLTSTLKNKLTCLCDHSKVQNCALGHTPLICFFSNSLRSICFKFVQKEGFQPKPNFCQIKINTRYTLLREKDTFLRKTKHRSCVFLFSATDVIWILITEIGHFTCKYANVDTKTIRGLSA